MIGDDAHGRLPGVMRELRFPGGVRSELQKYVVDMNLLPDTLKIAGCACTWKAGIVFPATAG